MSTTSTNDKPRLLYDQYHGQRGPLFEAWRKPFLDAAEGKGDDDASYAECYLGTDPQGGLTAAQVRRRAVRRRESYAMLIQHMTDESLKAVIRAEAGPNAPNPIDQRNGRTAWLTPRARVHVHVCLLHVPVAIVCPRDCVQLAFWPCVKY